MLRARHQLAPRGCPISNGDRHLTVAVPEVQHGVGREPQTGHPGDQRSDLGERDGLRAALGEVAAEGVIEASRRRGSLQAQLAVRGRSRR